VSAALRDERDFPNRRATKEKSPPRPGPIVKPSLPLRRWVVTLLRVRVWIAEAIRPGDLQLSLFWAGVIGFAGGLLSVGFRALARGLQHVFTQHSGSAVQAFEKMAPWQRILVPTVGGLIAGLVIYFGGRIFRGRGTNTDYMEAVLIGDGKIGFRASLVKSLSALFSISSGASIGREGPMVQLSAVFASLCGRFGKWPAPRRRLMVACGAAAGIAAAYNAPIAGALFVAEILLGSLAMESFGPLVFASVISTLTARQLLGVKPIYLIPVLAPAPAWEVVPAAILGLLCGLLAPLFMALLRKSQAAFAKLPMPAMVKPALGGLVVGMLALQRPEVCGNGESVVNILLLGKYMWQILAVILVYKVIATSATFGSGAVGGVFTPTLFIGACLGGLSHFIIAPIFPAVADQAPRFALVGMGAFLAATTQAPMMAIIMMFELTLDYQVVLPLMPACVLAYYMARRFDGRSIYSESLLAKDSNPYERKLADLRVGDLMRPNPVSVPRTAPFEVIAQTFLTQRFNYLYVTGKDKEFAGAISLHDVKSYLNAPELAHLVIADELRREIFPTITPEVPLPEALDRFAAHDGERLPVISDDDHRRLVGSISKTDIILALADRSTLPRTADRT
jgi:CIC family chloride channel protein